MWCADCQQDVPAVARAVNEPLVCPRCRRALVVPPATAPSDAGVPLDSFDRAKRDELASPLDWLREQETRERFRAIDRRLKSTYRHDRASATAPKFTAWAEPPATTPEGITLKSVSRRAAAEPMAIRRPTHTSWLLSGLLGCGLMGFFVGAGLLVWSAAFGWSWLWQQGMSLTLAAEGLLILSLAWMATRLWRNGRRVSRQLHSVDQQLAEVQQLAGTLAGSQPTASQQYYYHFSQAASPQMMAANLRGQVDQLAARIAMER